MPPDVMLTSNISVVSPTPVVPTNWVPPPGRPVTAPTKLMEPDALALVNMRGSGIIIRADAVPGTTNRAIAKRRAIRNLAPDCGSMVPPDI
jgi:hypothetical protein